MAFSSDPAKPKNKSGKRLYMPVAGIIASVLILVIVLIVFSYRSIHREGSMVKRFLKREGITLMNSLEAAARTGGGVGLKENQFQPLVEELSRQKDILYVAVLTEKGRVIAHSDPNQVGRIFPLAGPTPIPGETSDQLIHQDGRAVYEIRRLFYSQLYSEREEGPPGAKTPGVIPSLPAERLWIVLGVDPKEYIEAEREDRIHSILMATILFVVGAASLYFVFVLQNYSTVNLTLRRMQGYVRRVLESLQEGVITLDGKGCLSTVNRAGGHLLGGDPERLLGTSHRNIFHHRDGENMPASLEELFSARDREFQLCRVDGKKIPVSVTGSPLVESTGEGGGTVLLVRDLREVKRLQAEVTRNERLASVGRLAAGIAHEIRNPLSSIKGFAQFFRSRFQSGSDEQTYAEVIVKEVDRLNRVVTELLDYARPLEPHRREADLTEVINHALELVTESAKKQGVRIQVESENLSGLVQIDPEQMVHVFLNVFLNAIDAMDQGGVLSVWIDKSETGEVNIMVSDTGVGIPEEDLPNLFDPFFTTKSSGTGLGLAVVHRVVEAHNGTVRFDSRPGEGTTVQITLPPESSLSSSLSM